MTARPIVVTLLGLMACGASFWLGRSHTQPTLADDRVASTPARSPDSEREPTPSTISRPGLERLHQLLASSNSQNRLLEFRSAMAGLEKAQLVGLWQFARETLDLADEEDLEMAMALLSQLAPLDPQLAISLAGDCGRWKNPLLREVAAAWALVDLEPALAWIATTGTGLRAMAMRATLERIGDTDRQAALALFERGIDAGLIGATEWRAHDFLREWIREDPEAAMRGAMAMYALSKREDIIALSIATVAVSDPDAARAWLEGEGGELSEAVRNRLTIALIDGWAERSPREAAEFMSGISDPAIAGSAAGEVFADWAAQSFTEAAEWIGGLDDVEQRKDFEYSLMMAALHHGDRDVAFRYGMDRHPDNRHLYHAIYMHASSIVGDDEQAAVQWVADTFAHVPLLQEEIYNTLLHQMRWEDPSASAQHVHLMPDPIRRADDYEFHTQQWAALDLEGAREWANAMPDSADRDRALIGVAQIWMKQEPAEAAAWIGSLEPGELRDRVTSSYISEIREKDIPGALEMAGSIDDPFRRDDTLEYVFAAWLEKDPSVARRAIQQDGQISDTAKWRLLGEGAQR